MPKPRREWLLGALRLVGGSISAGAALVSILSYTTASHEVVGGTRAHRLALAPSPDSAGAIGDTVQLVALATDDRGAAVTGMQPVWTTTDPAVLAVDQAGTVVAAGAGSAAVVVRVGELEARRRIVVRQRPSALLVGDSVVLVHEGDRLSPVARVLDPRGRQISGLEPGWASGDPAVAAVDSSGAIVAVSSGETQLTAAAPGGLQGTVRLVVLPVPSSITVLAGEGQRAPAGSRLGSGLTAQVVSRSGRPVAGIPVYFEPQTGGSVEPAVDTTDTQGMVQTAWTLAEVPGRQRISVGVVGVAAAPVLTAEADPVPVNTRVALADAELRGTVGDTIESPVVARVTDSLGRALADIPIAWAAADGGSLTALAPRTDSLGEARALWRLGPKAGRQRARLQAGNPRSLPPTTISASARPGPAVAVAVAEGSGQLGTVGKLLKAPIVIRALDRYGNPVAGVPLVGASGSGAALDGVAVTDSGGKVRFRWTLGGEAGAQRLVIRLKDDTASAVVTARAAAGEPSALTLIGPGRWGGLTQLPVTVSLTDGYGNPVAGRVVTIRTGSGSVKPARITTDAEGRAQVKWSPSAKVRSPLVAAVSGTKVTASLSRPRP
jgi:Big-like domain-containing protein